jgi:hypothetical protein
MLAMKEMALGLLFRLRASNRIQFSRNPEKG